MYSCFTKNACLYYNKILFVRHYIKQWYFLFTLESSSLLLVRLALGQTYTPMQTYAFQIPRTFHNIRRQVCYRILPAGKTKEDSHNTHVLRCLLYFATESTNVLSGVCYSICMSLNIPFFIEYSFASYLSAIAACAAASLAIGTRNGEQETYVKPSLWQNSTEDGSPPCSPQIPT